VKIGLINNPLSRSNRARGLGRIAAVAAAAGASQAVASNPESIARALARFAEEGVELVVINGGDGTVQEVLTALSRDRIFAASPVLAVLHGGRTNVIAIDCGVAGAPERAFRRLLDATAAGKVEENIVERRVLRVEGAVEGETQYGMLFAAAAAASVVDYSRAQIDRLGLPPWASDLVLLMGIAARQIRRPRQRYAFGGYQVEGEADGASLPFTRVSLVLASTLDRMLMGARPYWNAESGPVRLTLMAHPPRGMVKRLPRLLYGPPIRELPADRFFSRGVEVTELRFDGRFILDGEFFTARADQPVRLTAAGAARFVAL
jgi:hypothetical protein